MNIEKQIATLNEQVKCTLAPSPIHGIGVFAIRNIEPGEKVYCNFQTLGVKCSMKIPFDRFNEIREEVRELILQRRAVVRIEGNFLSPNDEAFLISFMNHSDTPNYNKHRDAAIGNIKKGEEITEDYGAFAQYIVNRR